LTGRRPAHFAQPMPAALPDAAIFMHVREAEYEIFTKWP
jgi:hypothetical protein